MSIKATDALDALPSDTNKQTSMSAKSQVSKLDAALDRFLKVLPEHPYYLSVPTIPPLLDNNRAQYNLYAEHQRFRRTFPHVDPDHQYASSLFREPSDTVFEIHTQADVEREQQTREHQRNGGMNSESRPATPLTGATTAKKKLSLAAYKEKKEKGDISVRKDDTRKPNNAPEPIAKMGEKSSNQIQKQRDPVKPTMVEPLKADPPTTKKRKSPEPSTNSMHASPQPKKKLRESLSPEAEMNTEDSHGLPRLLSPILDDENDDFDLPPLLSPTLPPDVEEALRQRSERAQSDSSSLDTPIHKQRDETTPRKSDKQYATKSLERESSNHTASSSSRKEPIKRAISPSRVPSSSPDRPRSVSPTVRRCLVKMKYSKRITRKVMDILKLNSTANSGPKLGPAFSEREGTKGKDFRSLDKAQRNRENASPEPSNFKTGESGPGKQYLSPESAKKRRIRTEPDSNDKITKKFKPNGPVNGVNKHGQSPSLDAAPSTPLRDGKHVAPKAREMTTPKEVAAPMARTLSNASHLSTPRNLTPMPPSRASKSGFAVYKKYIARGRDLKHKADDVKIIEGPGRLSAQRQKAVIYLESLMSFMIGYGFHDVMARNPTVYAQTWMTLTSFSDMNVRAAVRTFGDLEGLRCYLTYVVSNRICRNMINALAAPVASNDGTNPPSPDAPSGGVDPKLPAQLQSQYQKGPQWIIEGQKRLSENRLESTYPRTWAGRDRSAQDTNAREDQDLQVERWIQGPYWLPISDAISPIQAVRFGIKFCTEWLANQGESYRIQLATGTDTSSK